VIRKKPLGKRTAILIHGGAIKAAFAAGVLYELSKLGLKTADIIIGTSSSAPTAAYFIAQQYDFIKSIWLNEVGTKEFVKYRNLLIGSPLFDVEYLIKKVFQDKYPLDIKQVINSKGNLLIPLYDYKNGRLEIFSMKEKDMENEFWHILQAAITIHDRHILSGSSWEKFVDADLDPFALYRQQIIPSSYNTMVITNHKHMANDLKKWLGVRIFRLLQSRHFPKGVNAKLKIREKLITTGVDCFQKFREQYDPLIISPPSVLKLKPTSVLNRDNEKLETLFNAGVRVVRNMMADAPTKDRLDAFIARSEEMLN